MWYGMNTQCGTLSFSDGIAQHESEEPLGKRYAAAVLWSFAHLSGSGSLPSHVGGVEAAFLAVLPVAGFMTLLTLLVQLMSALMQWHILQSQQSWKMKAMWAHLEQRGVSWRLRVYAEKYFQHQADRAQFPLETAEAMHLLPPALQTAICLNLYWPMLSTHSLLEQCSRVFPEIATRLCCKATATLLLSDGEVLFQARGVPNSPRMFVMSSGALCYNHVSGASFYGSAGHWFAEGVLWTKWRYMGTMTAMSTCQLCSLNAGAFQETVLKYPTIHAIVRSYAAEFVDNLNAYSDVDLISDLSQLRGDWGSSSKQRSLRSSASMRNLTPV